MGFPKDFLWGTATSSYQIEGAPFEDGKGACIWDDLTHQPGRIHNDSTGDTACDHYHRFREDVALLAKLGMRNYRFSINWARVLPEGTGKVNPAGLQFYSDLVDCLIENGIRPFITLYHWELPSALHRRGGFLNPAFPDWFAAYTRVVAAKLGDRVKDFFTINEPQCIIGLGYSGKEHAPCIPFPIGDKVRMGHNLLLAHGRSVTALREIVPGVRVGYAPCCTPIMPWTDSEADIEAARRAFYAVNPDPEGWAWGMTWFSDPAVLGTYPADGLAVYGKYLPEGWQADMSTICQKLDYYGQNIYQGMYVQAADNAQGFARVPFPDGWPKTAFDWPVTPDALYWGPRFMAERYHLPVILTENGMSGLDPVMLDGQVHDPARIDYVHRYLLALRRAAEEGFPVAGYFYWSFLDNFEWAHGYKERFGLVHVDFQTQQRIPKDSAWDYKHIMETNGAEL